jgi:hypothetical protein
MLRKLPPPPPRVTYCKQTSFLTSFLSRATLSLGAALLAFGGTAQAANILIVDNPAGDDSFDIGLTNTIVTNLQAICFPAATDTVTVANNALPSSLSSYDQVWDVRYLTALTAADQSAYESYLQSGGRMFLMGENANYPDRNASVVSFVSAVGGGTLSAVTGRDISPQVVQAPYNTSPNDMTALPVTYALSGDVNTPGTGQWITYNSTTQVGSAIAWPPGTLANATAGSLSVVLDVNFMEPASSREGVNNPPFLQNLCAAVATRGAPGTPSMVLTTGTTTRSVSQTEQIKATANDATGQPLPADTTVTFTVTAGPNVGTTGTGTTDANGTATFTYTGSATAGTDTIQATVTVSGFGAVNSNTLSVQWRAGPPPSSGSAASVPTLDEGALAALGLLLAGGAALALRRKTAS